MGLFTGVEHEGWEIGRDISNSMQGQNVIPITKLIKDELKYQFRDRFRGSTSLFGEISAAKAAALAKTLTQEDSSTLYGALTFCIREMMRNSFEHSKSGILWICGQYWANKGDAGKAQISIMDEGRGIMESLRSNKFFSLSSDEEANKLALEPGVSRMYGVDQKGKGIWRNSGYGLYMASSICASAGDFFLSSGKNAVHITEDGTQNLRSNIKGTLISLTIFPSKINQTDIGALLGKFKEEGERISNATGDGRILTASKVSSIASMTMSHESNAN